MDSSSSYNKNGTTGPNPPVEGEMEEKMKDTPTEVVDMLSVTPVLSHDTESSKTMVSNLDQSVSTEPKSDERNKDTSKTKETPDVLVDNESNEEGLIEENNNKPFDSVGNFPKFYLIRNQKEWLKRRMLFVIPPLYRMLSSSAQ